MRKYSILHNARCIKSYSLHFLQRSLDTPTSFTLILRRLFELTPINWEVVEQIVHGYLMQPVVINHGHGTVSFNVE